MIYVHSAAVADKDDDAVSVPVTGPCWWVSCLVVTRSWLVVKLKSVI